MARLNEDERQAYQHDGYVIPTFRLSEDRVAALLAATERTVAANPHLRPEHLVSVHVKNNEPEGVTGDQAFYDLVHDPEILDLVEDVLGPDIICWGAHLFCKPGGDGMEVPMHQDGDYWPMRPLATCSVWLALDHVTTENGCMRFIPGSHRTKTHLKHDDLDRDDVVLKRQLREDGYDAASAVNIELEPGQMSLHDVYLIHGSNANTSGKRRAGIALRYMPASSYFDRHMFPPSNNSGLKVDFSQRPLLLVRGHDTSGRNDLETGREWLAQA